MIDVSFNAVFGGAVQAAVNGAAIALSNYLVYRFMIRKFESIGKEQSEKKEEPKNPMNNYRL